MLLTPEERESAAQLDPRIAEILAKLPPPAAGNNDQTLTSRHTLDLVSAKMLARIGQVPASMHEFYHDITMRDGFVSSLKVHKPSSGTPGPLVVLCFGGAFVAGSKDQLSDVARALVSLFGATAISISYRLAPENKFPKAQEDALDSLKWIADNATSELLGADPSKGFVVGGVSAGGNLAAMLSREAQRVPLAHPLTGQWLAVPSIMDDSSVPAQYKDYFVSRIQNANAPFLTTERVRHGLSMTQADVTSDLRYPVRSTTPLSAQPRTYLQSCGMDPLRDDSLIYEEMLKEAGIPTKIDFYPGCPHAFWMMTPGRPVINNALVDSVMGHAWLLGKEISREDAAKALFIEAVRAASPTANRSKIA